eukprot:g264.t1
MVGDDDGVVVAEDKIEVVLCGGRRVFENRYRISEFPNTYGERIEIFENGGRLIAEDSFTDRIDVQGFKVPKQVVEIDRNAFAGCRNLTHIDLSSVRVVGEQSFAECSSLTDVSIPPSVRFLHDEAFADCQSLHTLRISQHCPISFGRRVFRDCPKLVNLYVGRKQHKLVPCVYADDGTPPDEVGPTGEIIRILSEYHARNRRQGCRVVLILSFLRMADNAERGMVYEGNVSELVQRMVNVGHIVPRIASFFGSLTPYEETKERERREDLRRGDVVYVDVTSNVPTLRRWAYQKAIEQWKANSVLTQEELGELERDTVGESLYDDTSSTASQESEGGLADGSVESRLFRCFAPLCVLSEVYEPLIQRGVGADAASLSSAEGINPAFSRRLFEEFASGNSGIRVNDYVTYRLAVWILPDAHVPAARRFASRLLDVRKSGCSGEDPVDYFIRELAETLSERSKLSASRSMLQDAYECKRYDVLLPLLSGAEPLIQHEEEA